MKFNGDVMIQAPREAVWAFLIDAESVSQCAPGLESLEVVVPEEKFKVVASVGFGTVKVTFNAEVEWLELEPPGRARMRAHGTAPGSAADATAEMVLEATEDGSTKMFWEADVQISGTITSLASRLMGGVTKRLTGAFFDCVKSKIEA
jgi:carbon monoxide dehydrogenase subunit G